MSRNVIEPFNSDVAKLDGYAYTNPHRRSCNVTNRRFSDVIIKAIRPAGKRIVDLGCGDGTYTAVLRAETDAALILGIDPATTAIERAQRRYAGQMENLAFRNCFAGDLVEQGEHFDVAVYRGVIHHTADPRSEIAAALKLADEVFFIEPNGLNPVVKLLERFSPYHRRHGERSFTLRRLSQWIEEAGGHVEQAFYFGLVPVFCPDWFVPIGRACEPVVERVPLLRALACGTVGILASSWRQPAAVAA